MHSCTTFAVPCRRTVSVSLIFATACVIVAILFTRKKEPSYGGYPLNNWVKLLSDINEQDFGPDCTQDKAPDAILAIGTNALPFLVEWIQYGIRHTPVRNAINRTIEKFPVLDRFHSLKHWAWRDSNMVRSQGAHIAFRILGKRGATAIPDLVKIASKNVKDISVQYGAVEALGGIGQPALSALLNVVTNTTVQGQVRWVAANRVGGFGTNAAATIPALVDVMEGDNPDAGAGAAEALAAIGLEPHRVVPAMARATLRAEGTKHYFIFALGKFGPGAGEAIPALRKIALGSDRLLSQFAVSAILKIQTNSPPLLDNP